jgi:hypothetical protein
VGLRAGLDNAEKRTCLFLPGLELRQFERLARSQSLYRLRYPGSYYRYLVTQNNRKSRGVSNRVFRLTLFYSMVMIRRRPVSMEMNQEEFAT